MPPGKRHRKVKSCRICLSNKSENRVTFDVDSEWSRLLAFCCDVNISEENGPRILCGECSMKLKEYSEFKTLALKNESVWNNILKAEVKNDISNIETVQVKDEDYSDIYQDNVYFDWSETTTDDKCDITEKHVEIDIDLNNEIPKVKKEASEKKIKTKVATQNNSEALYLKDFIKVYFKTINTPNAKRRICFECRTCSRRYTRRDCLSPHIKKCCNTDIPTLKEIRKAPEKVSPTLHYCGLCDFVRSDEKSVLEHVNTHCTNNDMNCKYCEFTGRDAADIVSHRYKHIPDDSFNKKQCPACKKQPKNLLTLQFHYRSVHLKKIGGWCSICNKTFQGYKYFRNHVRLHSADKHFICDFCGLKFLFRNLIIRHLEEHMDIRNYVCETCGKSFKRNNALTYHIRAFHIKNDPVTCDHCGKKFKNQNCLRMHMKMVRKGNNFICDVCSKGYPTLNLLRKHMFWHTGEKPFGCDTCGARYKSKQILGMHKRKHAGYLPFKCEICDKNFLSSYQLKVHMSIHTGIRRMKCLVCDKTFNERKRMLEHCKSKHDSSLIKDEAQCIPLTLS